MEKSSKTVPYRKRFSKGGTIPGRSRRETVFRKDRTNIPFGRNLVKTARVTCRMKAWLRPDSSSNGSQGQDRNLHNPYCDSWPRSLATNKPEKHTLCRNKVRPAWTALGKRLMDSG